MIPASYLFKDIYTRHWEEPDAPVITHDNHRFIDGLMTPLSGAITALLRRPRRSQGRHLTGPAYE